MEGRAEKPVWSRSNNTFRFNFLSGDSPALEERSSFTAGPAAAESHVEFTGQDSGFAFNFQIPPVVPEEDDMMTTEASDAVHCVHEDNPSVLEEVSAPPEVSKTKKKKKKSGKKKDLDNTEAKQEPKSAEGSQGGEVAELVSTV